MGVENFRRSLPSDTRLLLFAVEWYIVVEEHFSRKNTLPRKTFQYYCRQKTLRQFRKYYFTSMVFAAACRDGRFKLVVHSTTRQSLFIRKCLSDFNTQKCRAYDSAKSSLFCIMTMRFTVLRSLRKRSHQKNVLAAIRSTTNRQIATRRFSWPFVIERIGSRRQISEPVRSFPVKKNLSVKERKRLLRRLVRGQY